MLSRILLIFLAVILNIAHLFIPARVINYNFDPLLALLSFVTFLTLIFFTSSFRKDIVFIVLILVSFISQVVSYYQNGGAPDYINLLVLDSNIPDFLISATILTWWYYRVYKQPKIIPASIEQNA